MSLQVLFYTNLFVIAFQKRDWRSDDWINNNTVLVSLICLPELQYDRNSWDVKSEECITSAFAAKSWCYLRH